MNYIIQISKGGYVKTAAASRTQYTEDLQYAQVFRSREFALRVCNSIWEKGAIKKVKISLEEDSNGL